MTTPTQAAARAVAEGQEAPPRKSFCFDCGSASSDPDVCDSCGATSAESDNLGVTIIVTLWKCDACAHVAAALTCPECGHVEENPPREAAARKKALEKPLADLRDILESFDEIGDPHLSTSLLQFNAAVQDSRIYDVAESLLDFYRDRGPFVLNTTKDVKGIRPVVLDYVQLCEAIRARVAEIAWCDPPDEYPDARSTIINLGRQLVTFAIRFVELLMIVDGHEAQARKKALQHALDSVDVTGYTRSLRRFEELGDDHDDPNEILCRTFGIEGAFVDEDGGVKVPTLLQALDRDDAGVLASSGTAVGRMLASLPDGTTPDSPVMSMLVGQLAEVACSANPARSHRLMSYFMRALTDAWDADRAATCRAVDRLLADTRQMLVAQTRLGRRAVMAERTEDPLTRFEIFADMYRIAAEGAFRSYAALANELSAIVAGRDYDSSQTTLGNMVPQFQKFPDELARLLVAAVDVDLRNALAHETYEVQIDGDDAAFHLLDSGRKVSVDQLEEKFFRLREVVSAIDTVTTAFVALHDLDVGDLDAHDHPAYDFAAAHMFAAAGTILQSVELDDGTVRITVEDASPAGATALLAPIVSLRHRFGDEVTYEVRTGSALLVRVAGGDLWTYALERCADDFEKQIQTACFSAAALLSTTGRNALTSLEARTLASQLVALMVNAYEEDVEEGRSISRGRARAEVAWRHLERLSGNAKMPTAFSRPATILTRAPSGPMFAQALLDLDAWRGSQAELLDYPLLDSALEHEEVDFDDK